MSKDYKIVERETLLNELESVKAGLSSKDIVDQSACFAFRDNTVFTFNDDVACSIESCLSITGAIQSDPLINILSKLKEDELKVFEKDNEIIFQGKGKRTGIAIDPDIRLPIDSVPRDLKWKKIPEGFLEAIKMTSSCAGSDASQFVMTCIHIAPEFIEACDRYQAARFPIKTGFKNSFLVKRDNIKYIIGEDIEFYSVDKHWLHFKDGRGFVLSCRRYIAEDYPDIDHIYHVEGREFIIPKSLSEAAERASVFASDLLDDSTILLKLGKGVLSIRGEGASGWHEERRKDNSYKGEPIAFRIDPTLLIQISNKYRSGIISSEKLKVDLDRFTYVTCLGDPEE